MDLWIFRERTVSPAKAIKSPGLACHEISGRLA